MKQYWDGRFWPSDWIHLPARCVFVDCCLYRLQLVILWWIPVSCASRTQGIQLPPNCLPGESTNTLIGNAKFTVKKQFRIACLVMFSLIVTPGHQGHKGFNCLRIACLVITPTHWLGMLTLMLKEKAPATV